MRMSEERKGGLYSMGDFARQPGDVYRSWRILRFVRLKSACACLLQPSYLCLADLSGFRGEVTGQRILAERLEPRDDGRRVQLGARAARVRVLVGEQRPDLLGPEPLVPARDDLVEVYERDLLSLRHLGGPAGV